MFGWCVICGVCVCLWVRRNECRLWCANDFKTEKVIVNEVCAQRSEQDTTQTMDIWKMGRKSDNKKKVQAAKRQTIQGEMKTIRKIIVESDKTENFTYVFFFHFFLHFSLQLIQLLDCFRKRSARRWFVCVWSRTGNE